MCSVTRPLLWLTSGIGGDKIASPESRSSMNVCRTEKNSLTLVPQFVMGKRNVIADSQLFQSGDRIRMVSEGPGFLGPSKEVASDSRSFLPPSSTRHFLCTSLQLSTRCLWGRMQRYTLGMIYSCTPSPCLLW